MKCGFRVDTRISSGLGHIFRCMTLADTIQGQFGEFYLIDESDVTKDLGSNLNFQFMRLGEETELDLLVVDHYELDYQWESSARSFAKKILVLDELGNRKHDCDFLLDQTYGCTKEKYKNLVSQSTKLLLGTDYVLLRDEFLVNKDEVYAKRIWSPELSRLFINFGGIDGKKVVPRVIRDLEKVKDRKLEITITISSKASHIDEIKTEADKSQHKIDLLVDCRNMAEVILSNDFGICAGGTNTWERIRLGLPTIMIPVTENQLVVAESLESTGAVSYVKGRENYSIDQLLEEFERYSLDREVFNSMVKSALGIVPDQPIHNVKSKLFPL